MWIQAINVLKNSTSALIHRFSGRQREEEREAKAETIFRASAKVLVISNDDGAALLDLKNGVCCALDAVGNTIWQQIAASPSGTDLEAILDHLEQAFKVNRREVHDDAVAYLQNLASKGLVLCDVAKARDRVA